MKLDSKLIILIFGRVIQIVIALVAIKLATKYLNASEMGNYYTIVSIAGFFGFILVGPVGQYINRKTHQWYHEKKILNILYIYNYYIIFLSIISIGIINALSYFNFTNNINIFDLSIVFFIYILSHTWNQTIIPMINMLEHRVSFVFFTVLSQLLFLIFAYLFINVFSKEGIYWFLGQAIGFLIIAIISLIYFIKRIQNNFDIKIAHKLINRNFFNNVLKFSVPLSIGALFFWIQTQSYPLIIKKYIGSEFLGYFGVGISVAFAISSAFESIVMQYIYPPMYKSMNDEKNFSKTISKIINSIIPMYMFMSIFVSIFAIFINSILVDEKYFNSYIFVIFGIWIAFFRMSSNIISNIAHSKMVTKKLIYPNIFGAIVALIGIILAINSTQYRLFIPIVLLFSGIISFGATYKIMNNLVKINFKLNNLLLILLYSMPLLLGILFYKYAHNKLYSMLIVSIFGLYFLYLLYKTIKTGNTNE